jgi:uncharacterized protein with PIN domain
MADLADLCSEAVLHQNSLKEILLSQLVCSNTETNGLYHDTIIRLADGQLALNRLYLDLMFPGLGRLADFDGRSELVLFLPDFKRSDLLALAKRILVPALGPKIERVNEEEEEDRRMMTEADEIDADHVEAEVNKQELCVQSSSLADTNSRSKVSAGSDRIADEQPRTDDKVVKQHRCAKKLKQKPHSCPQCNECFPSRPALTEHCRQNHAKQTGKKPLPCSYCPEVYWRQDYLKVRIISLVKIFYVYM